MPPHSSSQAFLTADPSQYFTRLSTYVWSVSELARGRRITQIIAAVAVNSNFKGFAQGSIYTGNLKYACVPGLNCYSCPGAVGACPIGSLQAGVSGLAGFLHKIPMYVLGLLAMFGILLGRTICGFLCPFGLIQDLLYKIPTPKLKKNRVTRVLSGLKYAVLAVFVVALPLYYMMSQGLTVPAFCKYICPAGTLEAGIPLVTLDKTLRSGLGFLFVWKVVLMVVILVSVVFVFRSFCRFLCPLGAIYSFFNKYAVFGVKLDKHKCVNCGKCARSCKLDVKIVNDRECVRCGECKGACPTGAISGTLDMLKKHENAKQVSAE